MREASGLLVALVAAYLLGACTSHPRLTSPGPVCTIFDTSDLLFTYGPAIAREQTIQDLTKRIDKYLGERLTEDHIPRATSPCHQDDAILTIRIDSLETIANTKGFLGIGVAVVPHAKMKYVATLASPNAEKLFESSDDPDKETLDDLAGRVAKSIYKDVRDFYR